MLKRMCRVRGDPTEARRYVLPTIWMDSKTLHKRAEERIDITLCPHCTDINVLDELILGTVTKLTRHPRNLVEQLPPSPLKSIDQIFAISLRT
jgi:hypothetical protein